MSQLAQDSPPPAEKFLADASKTLHQIFFALFLISFVLVWLNTAFSLSIPGKPGWPGALLVFAAVFTTLVAVAQQLPGQNVLLAAGMIAAIAGIIQAVGALTGIPFGPYIFTEAAGPKIFKVLPWCIPMLWIVVLFNCRGVARLVLRPWRKSRLYGFRLIGVTAVLALAFDFGLEPFATNVKHYWLWEPTKLKLLWHGTPISNFLGWLVTVLIALAFATPVLINKSHRKYPPDYHPLIVWTLLNVLFLSGAIAHQLWMAVGFIAISGVIAISLAIRGARW